MKIRFATSDVQTWSNSCLVRPQHRHGHRHGILAIQKVSGIYEKGKQQ